MTDKKLETDLTTTIHLGSRTERTPQKSAAEASSHTLLEDLSSEEQGIVAQLAKGNAMLFVHRGPGKGARFLISGTKSIGRDPKNDIFLDDVTISRTHAAITYSHDAFSLEDLGSLNGTYVNGNSITQITLANGDEIQIGKFHMLFFGGNS